MQHMLQHAHAALPVQLVTRTLPTLRGQTIVDYLTNTVVPALHEKTGQGGTIFLPELRHRNQNHQIMKKWLTKFITYLDRYYVEHHSLPL